MSSFHSNTTQQQNPSQAQLSAADNRQTSNGAATRECNEAVYRQEQRNTYTVTSGSNANDCNSSNNNNNNNNITSEVQMNTINSDNNKSNATNSQLNPKAKPFQPPLNAVENNTEMLASLHNYDRRVNSSPSYETVIPNEQLRNSYTRQMNLRSGRPVPRSFAKRGTINNSHSPSPVIQPPLIANRDCLYNGQAPISVENESNQARREAPVVAAVSTTHTPTPSTTITTTRTTTPSATATTQRLVQRYSQQAQYNNNNNYHHPYPSLLGHRYIDPKRDENFVEDVVKYVKANNASDHKYILVVLNIKEQVTDKILKDIFFPQGATSAHVFQLEELPLNFRQACQEVKVRMGVVEFSSAEFAKCGTIQDGFAPCGHPRLIVRYCGPDNVQQSQGANTETNDINR